VEDKKMVKIYLDAGHGGKDSGAINTSMNLKEKDLVLDICRKIEAGLKDFENVQVLTTRTTDVFLSLSERTQKANNANCDILLSVHINSAPTGSGRGFESHIYPNSGSATVAYQNVMHQEILKAISGSAVPDRGKKQSNFHMLRESKMKAILTENLFVSNSTDAKLLASESFRQKLADGHVNGLVSYLGLKRLERPPESAKPDTSGKLYRVQVGAFEDKENADALAADLSRQGYRPLVKYE
jgi:N-acetylmuramoyl-L-alanine amidase